MHGGSLSRAGLELTGACESTFHPAHDHTSRPRWTADGVADPRLGPHVLARDDTVVEGRPRIDEGLAAVSAGASR